MKLIFCFVLLLLFVAGNAQDTAKVSINNNVVKAPEINYDDSIFAQAEIEAAYPGGSAAFARYISKTMYYPEEAYNKNIQGTVIVQFIVDKQGKLSKVEAIDGPTEGGFREEAVRLIKKSGTWVPGVLNGRKVKSYKKQPVQFKLVNS